MNKVFVSHKAYNTSFRAACEFDSCQVNNKVQAALSNEYARLTANVHFTGLQTVKNTNSMYKNRVDQISALTKTNEWRHWRHCPGRENPSDLGPDQEVHYPQS